MRLSTSWNIAISSMAAIVAVFALSSPAHSDDNGEPDSPSLHEQVIGVPVGSWWTPVTLQVTFMRPEGPGPFPLAVINHGKSAGAPRRAPRNRAIYASRYFLSRGYAVMLPMLRGFAGSSGSSWISDCDVDEEGLEQARDIVRAIEEMVAMPAIGSYIDAQRIVVVGQSLGGWHTLAVGALNPPNVKALVNFAGGRRASICRAWEKDLIAAAQDYGGRTHVPSIWFYGDNDSEFPTTLWHAMFESYTAAGGNAELVDYGRFMDDAHKFAGRLEALPTWMPRLDAFLARAGLPHEADPRWLPPPYPLPTHYADVGNVGAVPLHDERERSDYRRFLQQEMPRVFAITSRGVAVWASGGYDPLSKIRGRCLTRGWDCKVYAVDDQVVWRASP